jgi:hypothetical protein
MEDAFEEARQEDFRQPLYENLRQVFAGALETTPADEDEDDQERATQPKPRKAGSGQRKARKTA